MATGKRQRGRMRFIAALSRKVETLVPFWLYKLAHYKLLKPLVVTDQDLISFRSLNDLCSRLEADTKAELLKLNRELLNRVKKDYLDDYEIDVKFDFILSEEHPDHQEDSDNIFSSVEVTGSVWAGYEVALNFLADGQDWSLKIPNHPLLNEKYCYILRSALRQAKNITHFFHCEAVWVDIICRRQRVGYHPSYAGERFRSCRKDWADIL